MAELEIVAWKDEYSVGNSVIDAQHQKLFFLYNAMVASINGDGRISFKAALHGLMEYIDKHFSLEERYMEKAGYLEMISHKAEHQRFIITLGDLVEKALDASQFTIQKELADFLSDWMINHIMSVDREYMDSFRKAGL